MKNLLLSLILLSLNLLSAQAQQGSKTITLEDVVYRGTFQARSIHGLRSTEDGLHYTTLTENKIEKFAYNTGQRTDVLLNLSTHPQLQGKRIQGYELDNKEERILFYINKKSIYRHSFLADYYVYELKDKSMKPVSNHGSQQLATFSPNGKKIAFVRQNNIYIKDLETNTESAITQDGANNKIINGAPDWVYEEEFSFNRAFEWSPDNRYLAFIKFDESKVKEFSFPLYAGTQKNSKYELYTGSYRYKYPKAGEENSKVSVHVHDLQNDTNSPIQLQGIPEDHYIPRITWTESKQLAVIVLNRHQNQMNMFYYNPQSAASKLVFQQSNDRYIEESAYRKLTFLKDGKHFVYLGENDGFRHLYLYSLEGQLKKQLTKGDFDVLDFLGYNSKKQTFYYQAAAKKASEQEVYAINLKGKKQCLTPQAGINSIHFSKGFNYYIHYFSNSSTPTQVNLYNDKHQLIKNLEENKALQEQLKDYQIAPKTFFSLTTKDNIELNAWMVKPHDFDEGKRYPLLMLQYSGPNSQQVLNRWGLGWEQHLANMGYIVACVDGRGTGARGEDFRKCTYLQLGKLESDDQIASAQYFAQLPYIDGERIGIWGWSYGGFMSSLCLSKSNGLFKAGIAVAPVTHWKYYDSVYTERYMRTPDENKKGYDNNSPLELAEHLQGTLLLCHGSADDNVHFQNAMEYAARLTEAKKQFEMQIYPNKDHSIGGANSRLHLYTKFCNFLKNNL